MLRVVSQDSKISIPFENAVLKITDYIGLNEFHVEAFMNNNTYTLAKYNSKSDAEEMFEDINKAWHMSCLQREQESFDVIKCR